MRQALGAFCLALGLLWGGPALAQQPDAPAPDMLSPEMPGIEDLQPPPAGDDLPTRTIEVPDSPLAAAMTPVLTVDQDALYLNSAWGLRAQAELEAEGAIIATDNERLTQQLSAEEADLTERRALLPAAEFRRLAESFDLRATEIRRDRAQAVQNLNAWADADRNAFFRAALPVMGEIMQDRGAVAVLDRRTVFVSLDAIDITGDLIAMLDARIGDGAGVVPQPPPVASSRQEGDPLGDEAE